MSTITMITLRSYASAIYLYYICIRTDAINRKLSKGPKCNGSVVVIISHADDSNLAIDSRATIVAIVKSRPSQGIQRQYTQLTNTNLTNTAYIDIVFLSAGTAWTDRRNWRSLKNSRTRSNAFQWHEERKLRRIFRWIRSFRLASFRYERNEQSIVEIQREHWFSPGQLDTLGRGSLLFTSGCTSAEYTACTVHEILYKTRVRSAVLYCARSRAK